MAPKYHPTPLSGGDRKALTKELGKARAMTNILAAQSTEMRAGPHQRFCPTDGAPLDPVAYTEFGEGAGTATGAPDPCRSPLFQGKET